MEDNISQLPEAWQLAIRREKESRDFYARMAHSSSDASLKALFESLAAEEVKHRERLEGEYQHLFEADLGEAKGRAGTFEHALRAKAPALISWYEWGEEAFRLAQQLDVPILLSISAVWCHWCHVMDQTTFSDPEVATLIDAHFMPIRVDNDKRPDINARYNMGGWPTVAFLTPSGEVLTGGTYMPPAAFKDVLHRVSNYYRDNKERIQNGLSEMSVERGAAAESKGAGELAPSVEEVVYSSINAAYDREFGGFGAAPKFPQPDVVELLLARFRRTGQTEALEMAVTTLKEMAQAGMYDHEMGGFFRYSTTRDWSIPHFEKMLEDNARLLSVYLHAYQLTGEALLRTAAEGILAYVESTLRNRELSYFYGSQDADEKYYALRKAERAERPAPFVDALAYTSWNAMMSSAYLDAAAILERPDLASSALATVRFLWQHCWIPDRGICHYWDGAAHLPGLLADQVWMAHALLHAYEYTATNEFLQRAQESLDWVHSALLTKVGSFQDRPTGDEAFGRLSQPQVSLAENAVAAAALVRLARITGEGAYLEWARAALSVFTHEYGRYGYSAAGYALAVKNLLDEPLRVVVVGRADDSESLALLRAAWRSYAPNRTLLAVDPAWESERLKALGYPAEPAPVAYVCLGHTCAEPVARPANVGHTIDDLVTTEKEANHGQQ